MKEASKAPQDPKENTIDIFVDPKKTKAEPAPEKSAPKKDAAPRRPAPEATRKMDAKATASVRERANATRVSASPVRSAASPAKPKPAKPQKPKKEKEKAVGIGGKGVKSTLMLALIYIAAVILISAICSNFAIRWANDVFALVKSEVNAVVQIPENATISEVASILKENKIIEYPFVFRLYIGYKHRNDDPPLSFKSGDFELASTLNYDQIVSQIKTKTTRRIVKLTIPEGYSCNEIIDFFLTNGIGTRDGFVAAINEYPYE